MIRGKFLAQDDFDLAGHRLFNWKWLNDIPHDDAGEGQVLAVVEGDVVWATLSSSGIVLVDWDSITGKPTEFAPEAHVQDWNTVTGKPTFVNSVTSSTYTDVSATTGSDVVIRLTDNFKDTLHFFTGGFLETVSSVITADTTDITLSVESLTGSADFTRVTFDGFDTVAATSITLTAALTDTEPVRNFVYATSNNTVTNSTTGWPATIHAPMADIVVQTASSVALHGALKHQAWTDHMHNATEGHLSHLNYWIRQQPATWISGMGVTANDGVGVLDFAADAGVALQLHPHDFPAIDITTADVHVVNDSVEPYKRVSTMAGELTDSTGASMSGKYYDLVVWAVVSERDEDCQLMVNLPAGSYNTADEATADAEGYTDYSVPGIFQGCAVLLARIEVRHQNPNTYTVLDVVDLRGKDPNVLGGAQGVSVNDHGLLAGLTDRDHPTSALQQTGATTNQLLEWNGATWLPTSSIAVASISASGHLVIDGNIDIGGDIGFSVGGAITGATTITCGALSVSGTVTGISATDVGAAAATHTHSLSDLTQTGATTGQVPTWNSTASEWQPATAAAGGAANNTPKMIYVENPTATDALPIFTVSVTSTVEKVLFGTDAGTVTFNLEERASTTPDTAGTNVFTADITAGTTHGSTATFNNAGLAAETWVYLACSAVTGTPTKLWVRVFYSED